MTKNKHEKRRIRALAKKLGISYQAAFQQVNRPAKPGRGEVLEPRQQLAFAAMRLPVGPSWSSTIEKQAPSLRTHDDTIGPDGEVPLLVTVPIQFHWEVVHHEPLPTGAWRFDGDLWVESSEVDAVGGLDFVPDWLRRQIGGTCIEVQIHHHQGNTASVTAFFRPVLADREGLLVAAAEVKLPRPAHETLQRYDGRALCVYRTIIPGSGDPAVAAANARDVETRGYTIDVGYQQVGVSKADGERLIMALDRGRLPYRQGPLTMGERHFFGDAFVGSVDSSRRHVAGSEQEVRTGSAIGAAPDEGALSQAAEAAWHVLRSAGFEKLDDRSWDALESAGLGGRTSDFGGIFYLPPTYTVRFYTSCPVTDPITEVARNSPVVFSLILAPDRTRGQITSEPDGGIIWGVGEGAPTEEGAVGVAERMVAFIRERLLSAS